MSRPIAVGAEQEAVLAGRLQRHADRHQRIVRREQRHRDRDDRDHEDQRDADQFDQHR